MTSHLSEAIAEKIVHAESLYHRLVLVVGANRSANASALGEVAECIDAQLINVGLELSRQLLDLTERQRRIRVPSLLGGVVFKAESNVVLLNNIELLFDTALSQNPLGLLQRLSRRRTVVAVWPGTVDGSHLRYAVPDHPEYRRYPVDGLLAVGAEEMA